MHIATLLCALFFAAFSSFGSCRSCLCSLTTFISGGFTGKQVFYALDESERDQILENLKTSHPNQTPSVIRFKGLGEMNPVQLRETTMATDTRRLLQLSLDEEDQTRADGFVII